jgi:hypothetical protein
MYITGANLNIVNGSGSTDGTTNGLGNLIVGYNEQRNNPLYPDDRSGSHNIVVGQYQNFSSYGGLVGGYFNAISSPYASVSGGEQNIASGFSSSVSGGSGNTVTGVDSSVSGGQCNIASGDFSSVSGGASNTAGGLWSSVSGGYFNAAGGSDSSVSGGSSVVQTNVFGWTGGSYHTP